MSNKIFTKVLSLLLVAATLLGTLGVLSSCKKNENKTQEKMTVIVENGATQYTIIRADKADKATLDLIIKLYDSIYTACGCNIKYASDWVRNENEIDPNAKEILVGNTNRPETKEVIESLEPNSWAVVNKGNKIVICASNDALLSSAIDWFIQNSVDAAGKTVKIAEKLVKTEGFGNDLPISLNGVSQYQIVYPKNNKTLEYFASLVQKRANINSVVSDDKAEVECEIVIGTTQRGNEASFTKANEYSITTKGSKIFINASNESTLYYALNYYLEQGISVSDTVVSAPADFSKNASLDNFYSDKWSLDIPCIDEGQIAPVYDIGPGLEDDLEAETITDSYMHLVSNVQYSAFENYAKKLEGFGFNKIYTSKTENNDLWCYRLGGAYVYIHYSPMQRAIRVIWDKSSTCEVSDVDCVETQTKATTFYQYSLDHAKATNNVSKTGNGNGMLYIVKLQDNSLIMVDCGGGTQTSDAALQGLADFLYGITNTAKKDPLNIKFWYFTHSDSDHVTLGYRFMEYIKNNGYKMPNIEAAGFNFPSERANATVEKDTNSYTMVRYIRNNYPDIKYLKLHTGMVFNIAEVKFEVLGTIENIVNNKGQIESTYDTNDTCSMARMTFGGKSVLLTGDVRVNVETAHMGLYSKAFWKSDILQISHHGMNMLQNLYNACAPQYLVVPAAEEENKVNKPSNYSFFVDLVSKYNLHYAGNYTSAFSVLNGNMTFEKIPRYDNTTGKV